MTVESILRIKGRDVVTTPQMATLHEAARKLREGRIGALVVSDDGRTVIGIISERDIVHTMADKGKTALDLPVKDAMTAKVITVAPSDRVDGLMRIMSERRIRHLPVVDDGALCGMISIGDVVKRRMDDVQREAEALRDFITS